jgi:hypothetical protein
MFFSKRSSPNDFSDQHLVINEACIYPLTQTNFLGITPIHRLKWATHVSSKILAAKRSFFVLKNYLRATWGIDQCPLKMLVSTNTELVIL